MRMVLRERDQDLLLLAERLGEAGSTGGKVVLVRGEAGIGKSSLIREFCDRQTDRAHIHIGYCDDLMTPHPLGPFWDMAREESSLAVALGEGNRRGVLDATLDLLSRSLRPTVVVIEDTQWADEATLDAIKYLGRRIGRTKGLLVLTYRDGEVDADHPLRVVIGELPSRDVVRISLTPLSPRVVASMIGERNLDVDEVMALTGGNPLFVIEVLAAGVTQVSPSVQDWVLARAAKLSPGARRLLDLVSVIPGRAERHLIEAIGEATQEQTMACVRQGFLRMDDDWVSFNHELTRRAIESALDAPERRRLNRQVLAAIGDRQDWSRLVHHAVEANDIDSIVEFAPRAARVAMEMESHREALAHFRALDRHLDRLPPTERAALAYDWARTEFRLDTDRTVAVLDRAVKIHREVGDDLALARILAFSVRAYETHGRPETAEAASLESLAILESHPPGRDLAVALNQRAFLKLMQGDDHGAGIKLADRAIALATEAGDDLTLIRSLISKGAIAHSSVDRRAVTLVEDALMLAERGGHRSEQVSALVNLAGLAADIRDVGRAADFAQRAREAAVRYEFRHYETYALAMYSEILVWKGDWAAAEDAATEVLGSLPHSELIAVRMLALIQARRGRSETGVLLERMWEMAEASGELQHLDPGASVLAEYLWLTGKNDPVQIDRLQRALDRSMRSGFVWPSGALAFWMWKLGLLDTVPERVSDFYRWIIEGEWERAADFWERRGVPYERGLALMHGDDSAKIRAVEIFETLGAKATADRVRMELSAGGVRVPRGKARSTRDHAAGLTARQAEVFELVAEGLSNPEIADRLFLSYRTVENHVAAILMKLDVPNRDAAVALARRRGLLASV